MIIPTFIKPYLHFLIKLLIVAVVVLAVLKISSPIRTYTKGSMDNAFYVVADASVFVTPDTAVINFSFTNDAFTALEAQKNANTTINKITEELIKLGVNKADIKTTNYSISPIYAPTPIPEPYPGTYNMPPLKPVLDRISAYNANVSLSVKEKDLDKVNTIIDTAGRNGANIFSGVTFEVADQDKATDQARQLAIAKAKAKAKRIASQTGIKLGRILNVNESTPYPTYFESAKLDSTGSGSGTNVQPGQTEIKLSITLTYETL